MSTIQRLEMLIQSVLPAVWDDTLSHSEVLAKMVDKINEQTTTINELIDETYLVTHTFVTLSQESYDLITPDEDLIYFVG